MDRRFHSFDRNAPFTIQRGNLPHWSQQGTTCFITMRTNDSIPKKVLDVWKAERDVWLLRHGINPSQPTGTRWSKNWTREIVGTSGECFSADSSNSWTTAMANACSRDQIGRRRLPVNTLHDSCCDPTLRRHQNCLGRASTRFVDGVDVQRTCLVAIAVNGYVNFVQPIEARWHQLSL